MANPHSVGGKRRHGPQDHTQSPSPADPHDWEQIPHPTPDPLPYRTPTRSSAAHVDKQMPDSASRRTKHSASSSHRGRRASDDLRQSMPPPTTLNRSRTVTHRRGKESRAYEDEDDDLPMAPREPRPRPNMRRRARARSPSTSGSESGSGRSETVMTPPRSARVNHSTPNSRRSSRVASSRRAPSTDSASTVSTQHDVQEILRRGIAEIEVISDDETPGPRRHRRRYRERPSVVVEEEPLHRVRPLGPVSAESRPAPSRRHRHDSNSRSSSRRRPHQHRDHREEVVKPFSSKRGHKKYYKSDSVYVDRPKVSRSTSSHVTSAHSVSTSSKRSSTALNKFAFGPSSHSSKSSVKCVACRDEEIPWAKAAQLKCEHSMCRPCMRTVFGLSINDPHHMPPRCCNVPIPVEHVDRLFDTSFKKTWNRKFAEYSTRNRVYCPSRTCGEWIKPNRVQKLRGGRRILKCSHCRTEVCCACNGRWHQSKDCPRDEATNEILEQAKEYGWQRCYNCKEMVELGEGCNHMTCRCGAEFCMICGIKWKGCECPWFNFDAVEQDRLEYTTVPMDARSERERPQTRGGRRHGSRQLPQSYEEAMSPRRVQERDDEDIARRSTHDEDDDYDDDYDLVGVGNSAGHFMNDDYRMAPRVVPAAPSPPMQAIDRANGGDYLTGVNKARGLRASSMERRLADRFSEKRQGSSPAHRTYTMPISPHPPLLGMGMGGMSPPPPPHPPGVPYMRRAHTMDEAMYDSPSHSRLSERITPGRIRPDYEAEAATYAPPSRRRHRERERGRETGPPPHSVLAGLTGPGSGMNRVHEWRTYVVADEPDLGGVDAT